MSNCDWKSELRRKVLIGRLTFECVSRFSVLKWRTVTRRGRTVRGAGGKKPLCQSSEEIVLPLSSSRSKHSTKELFTSVTSVTHKAFFIFYESGYTCLDLTHYFQRERGSKARSRTKAQACKTQDFVLTTQISMDTAGTCSLNRHTSNKRVKNIQDPQNELSRGADHNCKRCQVSTGSALP